MFIPSQTPGWLLAATLTMWSSVASTEANTLTFGALQCNIDLNRDGRLDTVVLVENQKSYELVVLLKAESNYQAFVLSTAKVLRNLTCVYGVSIKATSAGPGQGQGKAYQTGGAYIRLEQPEGAASAYFWNGAGFTEVWTAD